MLITCPKCGFNQPQDAYCAKCGVDMANYIPKKKPLFQRIIMHPALPVVLVVLAVSTGITLYKKRSGPPSRSHMSYIKGSVPQRNSELVERTSATTEETQELASLAADTESHPVVESKNPDQQSPDKVENLGVKSMDTRIALGTAAAATGPQLRIQLYEIKETDLQNLRNEGQFMESGESLAGLIPKKKLEALIGSKSLTALSGSETGTNLKLDLNQKEALSWFVGSRESDSGATAGLSFVVNYDYGQNDGFEGEVEMHRDLLEAEAGGLSRKAYIYPFSLNNETVMIVSHFLPHQVSGTPEAWMVDPISKFLYSGKYTQDRDVNLLILFEIN